MLVLCVTSIYADVTEKIADDKSTTNAESAVKEKRGIHFHSYSSPYVVHSSPVLLHHPAPIVHAPIVHAPIVHHASFVQHAPIYHAG